MKLPAIDSEYLVDILLRLLFTPSPSGYTDRVVHLVCEELERLDVPFELTRRGAIRATLSGKVKQPDRAVVAHIDTLGAMVKALKDNGRLHLVPVGHWNGRFAEGARGTLFMDTGQARGTILPMKASGHTFAPEIDDQPGGWDHVEFRIDADVRDLGGLLASRRPCRRLHRHRHHPGDHPDRLHQCPSSRRQGRGRGAADRHRGPQAPEASTRGGLPSALHHLRGGGLRGLGGAASGRLRDAHHRQRHHAPRVRTRASSASPSPWRTRAGPSTIT